MEGIPPAPRPPAEHGAENHSLIPTGFTEAAKVETAEHILQQLQRTPAQEWLEKSVYSYMVNRLSRDEIRSIDERFNQIDGEKQYTDSLKAAAHEAVAKGVGVTLAPDWTGFYRPNPAARKREMRVKKRPEGDELVEISYKEYFTLPIRSENAEEALRGIKTFHTALPELTKELAELSIQEQDEIKLKVPGDLQFFIKHPDSIVVHFRNSELSAKVREVVNRHMHTVGIDPVRDGRAESGFDIKSSKERYDGSHSSLIASIVTDRVISAVKGKPELAYANPKDFIEKFLDRALAEEAAKSPAELLKSLDAIGSVR